MLVLESIVLALAWIFIAGTLLPFIREPHWWIRVFDFPRVQITVVMVCLVLVLGGLELWGGSLSWWAWASVAALAAAVIYQVVRIFPYTPLARVQTHAVTGQTTGPRLRLLISNVFMNNREYARWLAAVREVDPDVVVAVETDHAWMAAIDVLEAEGYGHTVKVPQDDTYGILVYSRLPLAAAEVRRVVVEEVPSVWVEIELEGGRRVQAVFLHPRPPRADLRQSSAQRDAELVLVARELEAMTGPRLVAGDLNDVAWSTTTSLFQEISGLLDPRVGRGTFATFHADHPLARFPLDHVFHSEHFKLVELRRLGKVGSDHFPILIELTLTPDAAVVQEAPRADTDTHAVGEEVLDDALEHLPKDPEVAPEDR